jgi:CRISPR type I-E-associated protein CasB/Cse2
MPDDLFDKFVESLLRLARERDQDPHCRAELARLRRGAGHDDSLESLRFVARHALPPFLERHAQLVSGLFALHSTSSDFSVGRALKEWADKSNAQDSAERRLRQVALLLRSKDIGLDWGRLLRDVHQWEHPKRFVQRHWARDFYWVGSKEEQEESDLDQVTQTQTTEEN